MYGKKNSKAHEFSGPQHANAEGASSRTFTKTRSIPIQRAIGNRVLGQLLQSKIEIRQAKPARTDASGQGSALPDRLKGSLKSLSGVDVSEIRVHRNSGKPAKLNALAYTQGHNIHLAPGQDQHLPHEAWHAVQQMQGRVKPTMQARGIPINDDAHLEKEADRMAPKAATGAGVAGAGTVRSTSRVPSTGVAQRKLKITGLTAAKRKKFVEKMNDGSALEYELDGSGYLQQKDKKKTAKDEYSKQILAAIADAQEVIFNLVSKDDSVFVDDFATGAVDYDDMMAVPYNLFRTTLLHFLVERFAVTNYEANKGTASRADFLAAHKKGQQSEERILKSFFPKKTIKYKGEGFNAASKKVDKAGNGSIDYEFDFTDVKEVYKQPIVGGVTKENIISSKIIVVK
jgi:hypothetical protein